MGWDGSLTHRQFLMWQDYLTNQLNVPSKDNYYQMQIATEIRRGNVKKPDAVKLSQFKIVFSTNDDEKELSAQELKRQSEETKRVIMSFMTMPVQVVKNGVVVDTFVPPMVKRKQILEEQEKRRNKIMSAQRKAQTDERTRGTDSKTRRGRK